METTLSSSDSKPARKGEAAMRTIGEVAEELDVPQHVLRFWESKFPQIKPLKRRGGRRFYRPQDVDVLRTVKHLLYDRGFTIKGAVNHLRQSKRGEVAPVAITLPQVSLASGGDLHSLLGRLQEIRQQLRQCLK